MRTQTGRWITATHTLCFCLQAVVQTKTQFCIRSLAFKDFLLKLPMGAAAAAQRQSSHYQDAATAGLESFLVISWATASADRNAHQQWNPKSNCWDMRLSGLVIMVPGSCVFVCVHLLRRVRRGWTVRQQGTEKRVHMVEQRQRAPIFHKLPPPPPTPSLNTTHTCVERSCTITERLTICRQFLISFTVAK